MKTNSDITDSQSYLRDELERHRLLFNVQSAVVQNFLMSQARYLGEAIINNASQVSLTLPDRVKCKIPSTGEMAAMLIPEKLREHNIGRWRLGFHRLSMHEALRRKLNELEQSPDIAIHTGAGLMRYTISLHLVHNMLPAGRSVLYRAAAVDETIPTIPERDDLEPRSALTSKHDAIVEREQVENDIDQVLVSFTPDSRSFFLPQWVAFGDNGDLLVNSIGEAEACMVSMKRYVNILHTASSLAPYMLANDEYQRKRYGILGQIINQGRALASYRTSQMIKTIIERVEKGRLNRGLSLNLPYFDDQELSISKVSMEVIPAGRIIFKPVFVVRAARLEHARISQDTRLNNSTRKYLLHEIDMLEKAFAKFSLKQVKV